MNIEEETKIELEPDQSSDFEKIEKATGYDKNLLANLMVSLGIDQIKQQTEKTKPR